jgi:NMD protein affecting ribosome stability and mRNA decay
MENCYSCDRQIEGKWDSTIQLAIEMGELEGEAKSRSSVHRAERNI